MFIPCPTFIPDSRVSKQIEQLCVLKLFYLQFPQILHHTYHRFWMFLQMASTIIISSLRQWKTGCQRWGWSCASQIFTINLQIRQKSNKKYEQSTYFIRTCKYGHLWRPFFPFGYFRMQASDKYIFRMKLLRDFFTIQRLLFVDPIPEKNLKMHQ